MSATGGTPNILEMTREERRDYIGSVIARAHDDAEARRATGLCRNCDEPIAGADSSFHYGEVECATHARLSEIEMLTDDQEEEDDE